MQPKRRMKEAKKGLKSMGAKKTGIIGKKQKKNRCNRNKNHWRKMMKKATTIYLLQLKSSRRRTQWTATEKEKGKKDRLTKEKVKSN